MNGDDSSGNIYGKWQFMARVCSNSLNNCDDSNTFSGKDTRFYTVEIINPCREVKFVKTSTAINSPFDQAYAFKYNLGDNGVEVNIHDYFSKLYRNESLTNQF